MLKIIAILIFLSVASAYDDQNGVLNLTEADFDQALKDYPNLFVKFYTPWCGHCKKLAPVFFQLAANLKTSHPEIQLADIDLEAAPSIQAKYRINGFPTLIYFKNGKEIKFGGSRNLQFMTFWLNKKSKDPLIPIQANELADLETDGNVNIIFYGDLNSPKADIVSKIASIDDYNMYYQTAAKGKSQDSIQIFRPFAKNVENNKIDSSLKGWISTFDRPFVYPFDDRSSGEIFSDKRNAVFYFAPGGETSQTVRQQVFQTAFDWKIHLKKRLIFVELHSTDESYKNIADHFKINPEKHFLVYVKTAEKLKYLYNGDLEETTKDKIVQFLKQVESKKIKPYKLDQETRPASSIPKSEQL